MLRSVGLIASLLFSRVLSADVMVANFSLGESYARGLVDVRDGHVVINVNISDLINSGMLPSGCVIDETDGILYHVHTKWTHTGGSNYTAGCGAAYTGGHYDPYGACGSSSGYSYCQVNGGCIPSTEYSCSSSNYASDAYACEVGDWSGKYGAATYDAETGMVMAYVRSFGEITGDELSGKSIVFHCANNKARAFCAGFKDSPFGIVTTSDRRQDNLYKLKADFTSILGLDSDSNAYFSMNFDGNVEINFQQNALSSLTCPGGNVRAWIGDAWNDGLSVALSGSSCTAEVYGVAHDPTNQCYTNETNSPYCDDNGNLCDTTSYTYSCNYNTDPFSCSPMDLSGRYGSISISANDDSDISIKVFDRYMADLTNLLHKSVVLTCASNGEPLACAKLQSVAVGTAVATFTNILSGAQGTVTVMNGRVMTNISFAYAAANLLGVSLPATCFNGGLKAHIHELWNYNDTVGRYGAAACGKTFTGGHWDPWAACSTTTGYTTVCEVPPTPSPTACVTIGGSAGDGAYRCNATEYMKNPFLCEVGDWSSKYGAYQLTDTYMLVRSDASPMEVDATELVGRSIVFHCNDASRAFCAPFLLQDGIPDGVDSKPVWTLAEESTNQIASAMATLKDDEGTIELHSNGHYIVDIDISADTNCSWEISYAVFKDETCTSGYDPTIQCIPISEHDGVHCFSQATCDVTPYYCDWWNAPYSCSPSDLSGKYGITDLSKIRAVSGWDELMIPLSHLEGKYLGLYCTDTWEVIECQPWTIVLETTTSTTTDSPSSTETTKIAHKQSYTIGLILALIMTNFLY